MDLSSDTLAEYLAAHTSPEPPLLQRLNRETHAKILKPRMLSGHYQGRLLAMIAQLLKPQYVLEIGTFTGYAAHCLAEGLREGGQVHTIEANEELERTIRQYITEAHAQDRIILHIGKALEIIPALPHTWDLVFIDADKNNYPAYYEAILPRVRAGGLILLDNVLWDGKVLAQDTHQDKKTRTLAELNDYIQADVRVENVLLPIRDGLMMVRKR